MRFETPDDLQEHLVVGMCPFISSVIGNNQLTQTGLHNHPRRTGALYRQAYASTDGDLETATSVRLKAKKKGKAYGRPIKTTISKTATQFTTDDDEDARFKCPVPACAKTFNAHETLAYLWEHCSDPAHQHALYEDNRLRCEFGCHKGFSDTLARLYHYSNFECGVQLSSLQQCPHPNCGWRPLSAENKRNP